MAPKKRKTIKPTVKFLAACRDPQIVSHILSKADKNLVKGICNAAYNVTRGDVPLSRPKKRLFAKYRPVFDTLTAPNKSLEVKRQLVQKGGALPALIPILLSTVLGTIGSALFSR